MTVLGHTDQWLLEDGSMGRAWTYVGMKTGVNGSASPQNKNESHSEQIRLLIPIMTWFVFRNFLHVSPIYVVHCNANLLLWVFPKSWLSILPKLRTELCIPIHEKWLQIVPQLIIDKTFLNKISRVAQLVLSLFSVRTIWCSTNQSLLLFVKWGRNWPLLLRDLCLNTHEGFL